MKTDKIPETKFKILYFKPNGKFYTDAEVSWKIQFCEGNTTIYMADACEKLRGLRDSGGPNALPGLCGEGWKGFIMIDSEDGFPCLILP